MPVPKKQVQNAASRPTEGVRQGEPLPGAQAQRGLSASAPRKAGRPKGAKNKPKGLLPNELANAILLQMKDMLPPEHFEYMKGVVKEGKAISTKNEMSILILLLSRNLYPALVMESLPQKKKTTAKGASGDFFEDTGEDTPEQEEPEEEVLQMPEFRKDVTERLKVLQSLLASYEKIDRDDKAADSKQDTILTITAQRGLDLSRLSALVGIESGPVAGNADTIEGVAHEVGDVSDQTSERQVLLPGSEQGETDRG